MCHTHSQHCRRRGATLVETALVLSSLFVFFFAIVEYGRFIMVRQAVDNATREGARLTLAANALDTNSFNYQTDATIKAAVINALGGLNTTLSGLDPQIYLADAAGRNIGPWTSAQDGQNIAVEINATYAPILPSFGFLPTSVPISAKCVMRTEGN